MKIKSLFLVFVGCLFITSCKKDTHETKQNSFETTFQKKGLSEPFSFQYAIKTEEGDVAMLSAEQVMNFMTGKMFNEDLDRELTDYQLEKNPEEKSNEYALMASSIDGHTNVTALLLKTEYGFVLTGGTCECNSTCEYGCSASSWGGDCRCSPCSNRAMCNKKSTIKLPDTSIIAGP
jgi:hypothetical protein